VLIARVSFQEFEQGPLPNFLDPQRFGDGSFDHRKVPNRGQRDKPDALGELGGKILRNLEGQSGLCDAPGKVPPA
jgi:hypothetical protein